MAPRIRRMGLLLITLEALISAGCALRDISATPLFVVAQEGNDVYTLALREADEYASAVSGAVIGYALLQRDDEAIQAFIEQARMRPGSVVHEFDVGVPPVASCIVESVDDVSTSAASPSSFYILGTCRAGDRYGEQSFSLQLASPDGVLVSLRRWLSDFSVQVSTLQSSPYVLALELDGRFDERERLRTCMARGGRLRGNLGYQYCAFPYADAGNTCADSSECEGMCLLSAGVFWQEDSPATGVCQAETTGPGCYATVSDGRSTGVFCVD